MTYSPRWKGRPEGYPYMPVVDPAQAVDRHHTYSVTTAEPKPAMTISLTTGKSLPDTVWQLHQLKVRGAVTHTTDDMGVMRWKRKPNTGWDEEPPF